MRTGLSECGDSSPLLLAATRRGEEPTADKSAVEKAGASSRTPKLGIMRPHKLLAVAGSGNHQEGRIATVPTPPFLSSREKSGWHLPSLG